MTRFFALLITTSFLTACVTTNPGEGASIQYKLPKTSATASLTMILDNCPTDTDGIKVEASLSVTASAGVQDTPVIVSGAELASIRTRRSLTINVNEDGVLSGVNAASEDRTSAIISNTLSAVTTLTGALTGPPPTGTKVKDPGARMRCNKETRDHLTNISNLRAEIEGLRHELSRSGPTRSRSDISEDINVLALEVARIRTGPLMQVLNASVPLGVSPSPTYAALEFKYEKISEDWFEVPMTTLPSPAPGVPTPSPIAQPLTKEELNFVFGAAWKSDVIVPTDALSRSGSRKKVGSCKLKLAVPSQTQGTISLQPYGIAIADVAEDSMNTPIPQWNPNDHICLSARFAENRTVAVTFNPFGQRQSLSWTSQAQGETATSALSSLATSATGLKTALEGQSELERQQAEILRVNTQIQYNNVTLCEMAAQEGATSCPTPNLGE